MSSDIVMLKHLIGRDLFDEVFSDEEPSAPMDFSSSITSTSSMMSNVSSCTYLSTSSSSSSSTAYEPTAVKKSAPKRNEKKRRSKDNVRSRTERAYYDTTNALKTKDEVFRLSEASCRAILG